MQHLSLWSEAPGCYQEILPRLIVGFEETNPEVKVETRLFGGYAEYLAALAEAGAGGPDILSVEPGGPLVRSARAGGLLALDAALDREGWRQRFYPGLFHSLFWREKIYGIPLTANNLQVLCNSEMLSRHGLAPPVTITDLAGMVPVLAPFGCYSLALGLSDLWSGIDLFVVLSRQLDAGQNLVELANRGELSWEHPIFVEAMRTIEHLAAAGVFHPGANSMSFHREAVSLWLEGRTALLWPGTNFLACSLSAGFAVDSIWFPMIPGGRPVLTGGVALCLAVNSRCSHPELAIRLLQWLTNDLAFRSFAEAGICPGGPFDSKTKSPSALADKLNAAQAAAEDRRIYCPEVYEAIGHAVQEVIDGRLSPQAACRRIQSVASGCDCRK